jgi:phosphoserine phosphatase
MRAMKGELGYQDALKERVALLAECPNTVVEEVLEQRITLRPGGKTLVNTMKANGAYTALVSGGFTAFSVPVGECLRAAHQNPKILQQELRKQ